MRTVFSKTICRLLPVFILSIAFGVLAGCSSQPADQAGSSSLKGSLVVDGSGTVFPIGAALAELFNTENSGVDVTVGNAGTGAGFEKFARGEIQIANASRPIKDSEMKKLADAGIEFFEIPIAYDGLCIIVHPSNSWLKSITIEQLHKIWDKDSKVKMWSDVDPSWPKSQIKLYGPTSAHGTYEYFNEVVNGDKENVRPDYSQQAEYDPLIQGVASEKNALGYLGYAYAQDNSTRVKVVPVDGGKGPITPDATTILSGSYTPFSRPLMMYVSKKAYDSNEAVKAFANFTSGAKGTEAVIASGYVPLAPDTITLIKARLSAGTVGSALASADSAKTLAEIYQQ